MSKLKMPEEKLLEIVSRETFEKFGLYVELLRTWNTSINLVSSKSIQDVWNRHIYDSAQLFSSLPPLTKTIVDLGSGAGFPGLVLAMMGDWDVTLVESDSKKCSFMREVARQTGTRVVILNERIETAPPQKSDVATSRALAPLEQLLAYASPFFGEKSVGLFLKGKQVENEIDQARLAWTFKAEVFASKTGCEGCVLRVEKVYKRF